ncbi:MAG TPA: hypothetical protein VKJ01_20890 [Candidatus Solibacter sp.]|nr:hypothetical protein [Candidatus Solibacter sp.]
MNEQLMVTIAAGPVLSLIVVISGYIVQNANLNSRMAEMNSRMIELKADLRELMNANTAHAPGGDCQESQRTALEIRRTRLARGQA